MRVCVKEKLRIGGGTIQLSVTQSIVQPVWSDASARSLTRRTEHHDKSAVTAETTNHLKRGLSSRCWIQLAYHSFRFLDKKFEWLRKNNNNKPPSLLSVKMKDSQRVYRNLRVSSPSCRCANRWHGYSGVTDENALLFMGKRENTSSAAPPPPPAPASGSRAVISPLPVSHWQIKSPLKSGKMMEHLCCFPQNTCSSGFGVEQISHKVLAAASGQFLSRHSESTLSELWV